MVVSILPGIKHYCFVCFSASFKYHFDTVNPSFDTVNDTVNDDVFLLIKEKNTITATEISERLNLSLSSVRRRMRALKDAGKLQRLGSDKNGHWRIIV